VDDVALGRVKDRAAAWVAWFMLAIFVIGCGIAVTLEVAKGGFDPDTLTLYLAFTGFMVVGAVIVAHVADGVSADHPAAGPGLLGRQSHRTSLDPRPETSTVGGALVGLLGACMVASISSLVVRFRRSQGVERQQLKWVVYVGVLLLLTIPVGVYLPATIGDAIFGLIIAFLPVAAGIAILRYRLYDIDRLINRTLVYGLVTAILGGLYAAIVLVLGQVFGGIGDSPPSWAVAGATLAVAALFQPARRRIQAVVDRRFNRRKYNAARTIEAFSTRLRDQVDLDTLSTELLAVVDQTMEPTRISLWLRPSASGSSGTPRSEVRPATWAY
jgi:hypothetical protein